MVVRRSSLTVRARVAVLAGLLVVVALLTSLALRGDGPAPGVATVPTPPGEEDAGQPIPDPFAYDADDEDELVRRAAAGTSHILYARSPGGATATAPTRSRRSPAPPATSRSPGRNWAATTWRSSRTTWGSATSRTSCART